MNNSEINLKSIVWFLLAAAVCLPFCRRKDDKKFERKLTNIDSVPSPAKYYFTIVNEMATNLQVGEEEVNNKNSVEIGLLYIIQQPDSNRNTAIKITFDRFYVTLKNKDQETELNADNAANSSDPTEQFLGKIKGSSINVLVNVKGAIISQNNNANLVDSLVNSLDIPVESTKQQLRNLLDKLIGNNFISNSLQSTFNILPDSVIHAGDTWTKENTTNAQDLTLLETTTFKLVSFTDKVATIETSGEVVNSKNVSASVQINQVNANLKGTEKGEFEIDLLNGLLLKGESISTTKGTVQVMGREVPITIKLKKKITGKKL